MKKFTKVSKKEEGACENDVRLRMKGQVEYMMHVCPIRQMPSTSSIVPFRQHSVRPRLRQSPRWPQSTWPNSKSDVFLAGLLFWKITPAIPYSATRIRSETCPIGFGPSSSIRHETNRQSFSSRTSRSQQLDVHLRLVRWQSPARSVLQPRRPHRQWRCSSESLMARDSRAVC